MSRPITSSSYSISGDWTEIATGVRVRLQDAPNEEDMEYYDPHGVVILQVELDAPPFSANMTTTELIEHIAGLRAEADRLERALGWQKSDPSGLTPDFVPEPHVHPNPKGGWTGHCHDGGWTPHRHEDTP